MERCRALRVLCQVLFENGGVDKDRDRRSFWGWISVCCWWWTRIVVGEKIRLYESSVLGVVGDAGICVGVIHAADGVGVVGEDDSADDRWETTVTSVILDSMECNDSLIVTNVILAPILYILLNFTMISCIALTDHFLTWLLHNHLFDSDVNNFYVSVIFY